MKKLTNYQMVAIYHLCSKIITSAQKRGNLISLKIFKSELNTKKTTKYFICFYFQNKRNRDIHVLSSNYLPPFKVYKELYEKQDDEGYEFTDRLLNKAILEEDYY